MDWTLELIIIPVTDVERAKHFYSEQLGFAVDHDTQISEDTRVVQLTPPGSGCSIAIGVRPAEAPPGSAQGMQLVVSDIAAAREQLLERGVEVSSIQHYGAEGLADGPGGRWNSFVFFTDPDGNGWALQERPAPE